MQALQSRQMSSAKQVAGRQASGRTLSAPAALTSSRSRQSNVQVFAGKKGKTSFRANPAQKQMMQQMMAQQATMQRPAPDVDPDNEEIVVFFRALQANPAEAADRWNAISVMRGSSALNILAKVCRSEWGRKLYAKTLIRQIGLSLYKESGELEKSLRNQKGPNGQASPFQNTPSSAFQYGFKIRDKANPKVWDKPVDMTVIPSEAELQRTALDDIKDFFGLGGGSSSGSSPAQ